MSRSKFKGPFFNPLYKNSLTNSKIKHKLNIKTKTNIILPEYVSNTVYIYNGKKWLALKITENMVGNQFGVFISTRSVFKYKK